MTYTAAHERYDTMQYRRTGRSGLMLPEISLGLWHNFGDGTRRETQRALLRRAFDLGITHFDLANNYGPPYGSAETNFGQIFAEDFRPYRDELILSTKAGYDMWPGPYGDHGSRKYLVASLDQSLRRMSVDYVDIFYHHRPDPETPIEETAGALASIVQSGKSLYVGVSNYSPEQTQAMVHALAEHRIQLLIHQPSYNMFNRTIENGLLDTLDAEGVGAICFVPLAQGLLTDRYLNGIPDDSRVTHSQFLRSEQISESYLARIRSLHEIAEGRRQTIAQLALNWVLRHRTITSALIGASRPEQLDQNVAALQGSPLTDDEMAAIEPLTGAIS